MDFIIYYIIGEKIESILYITKIDSYVTCKGDYKVNTKVITTDEAIPGMVVAEDIFGLQDYLIIPAHSELTNHSITRLRFYAIDHITIEVNEDVEPETVDLEDMISDTYSEYIQKTPEFKKFQSSFDATVEDFKICMETLNGKLKQPIAPDHLLDDMKHILTETRNGTHIVHMLECLHDSSDATYHHSIRVAVLCNVVGHWMNYSEDDIRTLTLAGMLHDIGKTTIPSAIIDKPSRLTPAEFEIIKTHPQNGYDLLSDQDLDARILNATLMHHERIDGSGYPKGLKGAEIDDFAQIVAITDIYIAMISPRVYRRKNCPFDAMSVLEQEGYQMFSPKILLPFLEGMANTYVNETVVLSDDRVGEIILIDPQHITRPMVKVGNSFIDLKKHPSLHIQDIL